MIKTVIYTEWLQLKRSPAWLVALAAYVCFGGYAMYYGHETIQIQRSKIIAASDTVKTNQIAFRTQLKIDTTTAAGKYTYEKAALPSLVRFNYVFLATHYPAKLSELCIGQRDLFPLYYPLTAQSYYVQTLKGEIYNPFKLSAGNFDLVFVIIYLMPLLLVGFCFDLLSAEIQAGTDKLLIIATGCMDRVLVYRLFFRLGFVLLINLLLSVAGFIIISVWDLRLLAAWIFIIITYGLFWAGLALWINSFKKDSAFNAIALLSSWVLFTMLIPAGINLLMDQRHAVHRLDSASLMRSRNMPETDDAMKAALDKFYAVEPAYRPQDKARSPYYFQGYSAFLFNNDRQSDQLTAATDRAEAFRKKRYDLFNPVNPAYNAEELLSTLSETRLEDEWQYKSAARQFHKQIFAFTAGPLFSGKKMTLADYNAQPRFNAEVRKINTDQWLLNLSALLAGVAVFWLMARIKLKRTNEPS